MNMRAYETRRPPERIVRVLLFVSQELMKGEKS
jgi:hypothetical protein